VVDLVPSGFVLVRADDDLPPIKLHSSTGSYGELPAGFRAVIEAELAGELTELGDMRQAQGTPDTHFRSAWQALTQAAALDTESLSLTPVATAAATEAGKALVTTKWGQTSPYNCLTPVVSGGYGGHAPAGCGPIAMAQILRYHKSPAAPIIDFSYTDSQGYYTGTHYISDVGGLDEYDWASMPTNLTTSSTLVQRHAVGRLIYHCGVALRVNFEASTTGVISVLYSASAFRDVFGYTCEDYQSRSSFSTADWFGKIQADVDAKHPIYYAMASAAAGHVVVCDGYRNGNEIHLNFGSSGYGDAWYNIDSVVFYNYTWSLHEAVFGITPGTSATSNTLTVVNGTGGGKYLAGTSVEISADEPQEGYLFSQWTVVPADTDLGSDFVQTQAVTSVTMPTHSATMTAGYKLLNKQPVMTKRSPSNDVVTVKEGVSAVFSATASDSTDPNPESRGMQAMTWLVDGVQKQVTLAGGAITVTGTFAYTPDLSTVSGEPSKEVAIKAVALDKQGAATETSWMVCVSNVPVAQAITFKALSLRTLGTPNFDPGATASSGLTVDYVSSNLAVAEIVDGWVHIVGAGSAVITARQAGNVDYKAATPVAQTLTVKASVAAYVEPASGGTVTGAGLYTLGTKVTLTAKPAASYTFLRWNDDSQIAARSFMVPNTNVEAKAYFGITTNLAPPTVENPGAVSAMVGVAFVLPLTVSAEYLPTVTVSGLPAGLRYDATRKAITGIPTTPTPTNKAPSQATVSVTDVARPKSPVTAAFSIAVSPLPTWAVGTFNGPCAMRSGSEPGVAVMTVSQLGKITGRLSSAGSNYAFSAVSYTNGFTVVATATGTVGRAKVPLVVTVSHPEGTSGGPASLGEAQCGLDASQADNRPIVVMYRNVWKDADMTAVATNYAGYYTATLPGDGEYGSGYLTFTVDKAGGVKTAGKLADGTAVSQSATLILDEAGTVWMELYTSPTAYKGGCLFGSVEFLKESGSSPMSVSPLEGSTFLWKSRDPQATADYRAGFSRELGLSGGWYDTVGNLYGYYRNQVLSAGTDVEAPTPELWVGTNRYASVWWNPNGIELTVVTNKAGLMTGLSVPKVVTPQIKSGAYDYAGETNTVGMTVTLTRATGVFKGAFKAWFDYATSHTPKSIAFEGVLTPERGNASDGVAGRGYFLWADKRAYTSALGKPASYSFNWSYDFLLLSAPAVE